MTPVQKLTRIARSWGGDVVRITAEQYSAIFPGGFSSARPGFYENPFINKRFGTHPATKRLLYVDEYWTGFVHELGHLFATKDTPNEAEEWDFFGWEYCLAKKVGNTAVWCKNNGEYGIGSLELGMLVTHMMCNFGTLKPHEKKLVIADRIAAGKKAGIISRAGNPLSIWR